MVSKGLPTSRRTNMDDPRLKLIEVVLTLGGFLGLIVTLEQSQLPSGFSNGFIEIIVLYLLSGFLAYASIAIPMRKSAIDITLAAFSASFSALLTLTLSIPISSAAIDVAALSKIISWRKWRRCRLHWNVSNHCLLLLLHNQKSHAGIVR